MPALKKTVRKPKGGTDIELTIQAFEMPKVALNHDLGENPTERNVYFSPDIPTEESKEEKIDPILDDFTTVQKEMLENSNCRVPDAENENTDSYDKVRRIIFGQSIRYNIVKMEQKLISFSDIVDIDEEGIEIRIKEGLALRFGEGNFFRIFVFLLIILNSIVIGLETDEYLSTNFHAFFTLIDYVFLTIFIAEILLKWYYGFFEFFRSIWNYFDFFIVLAALLPGITYLSNSRTLRLLRVMRTLRSLRSVSFFQGLDMVIQTIFDSIPDVLNIGILIILSMFIWAVVGVSLFGSVDQANFGDIGKSMFTLFIIISEDGWVEIHESLQSKGYFLESALFFGSFLTIGAFVLQKVIVAIVVANLEESQNTFNKRVKDAMKSFRSEVKTTRGQKTFQRRIVPQPPTDDDIWVEQIPFELPNFDNISVKKLEKYFLVLSIIETNLGEYQRLKEKLADILEEVKLLNEEDLEDLIEDDEEIYDEDMGYTNGGDVMTSMMANPTSFRF